MRVRFSKPPPSATRAPLQGSRDGSEEGQKAQVRFWAKVDSSGGPEACWPWTRAVNADGYGVFRAPVNGKWWTAHRYALTQALGRELAPGMLAIHSCDQPRCANPSHLREGTQADNMADAAGKGRTRWRTAARFDKARSHVASQRRREDGRWAPGRVQRIPLPGEVTFSRVLMRDVP